MKNFFSNLIEAYRTVASGDFSEFRSFQCNQTREQKAFLERAIALNQVLDKLRRAVDAERVKLAKLELRTADVASDATAMAQKYAAQLRFAGGVVAAGRELQHACHLAAATAGWWGGIGRPDPRENPMCFSQKLMLCVTELAEACEGDRKNLMDDHLPHRKMREVELADAVIRIFDMAGAFGLDLGAAIDEKMRYNAQRLDHKPEAREAEGGKTY